MSHSPIQSSVQSLVQLERVFLSYSKKQWVLRDINLTLNKGSFYFLTGMSGAGKSSFLQLLYMALLPSRGVLRMGGVNVAQASRAMRVLMRRKLGVVFQNFRLLSHLTAEQNAALPLYMAGVPYEDALARARRFLDWADMSSYRHLYPKVLSGGQQQRIAIVRAVIHKPSLILADEPTGSVDKNSALRFFRLFEELNNLGATVLIATHDTRLVDNYPYDVIHIDKGSLSIKLRAKVA